MDQILKPGQRRRLRWLVWRERLGWISAAGSVLLAITGMLIVVLLDEPEPREPVTARLVSSRAVQSDTGARVLWNVELPDGRLVQLAPPPEAVYREGAALCVREWVGRWFGRSKVRLLHEGACSGAEAAPGDPPRG